MAIELFDRPLNRWWTVLAGALGCAAGAGVVSSYVFGVFIKSISAEFHWERSYTTLGITSFFVASGIGSITLGSIMTKWGVRGPTLVFSILFGASLAAVPLLPQSVFLFCCLMAAAGFFGASATAMPYAIAISGWFNGNRGLALAISNSGTALSGVFMPSYANWLMERYGWRGGYVGVGVFVAIVSTLGLLLFFRSPPNSTTSARQAPSLVQIARGSREFWLIALAILMISMALLGLITNMVSILSDRGMKMSDAAKLLGLIGGSSWLSRIGLGAILDRIHVRFVAAAVFFMIGVGATLIALGVTGGYLAVALVIIGLGVGAEADLLTYAVSRYFDAQSLSRALGGVWIFWAWGSGIGVSLGSLSYDLTKSYQIALIAFLVLAFGAALTILGLGRYRFGPEELAAQPEVRTGAQAEQGTMLIRKSAQV
jgi:MFS family permease